MKWGFDKWTLAEQEQVAFGLGYSVDQLFKILKRSGKNGRKNSNL